MSTKPGAGGQGSDLGYRLQAMGVPMMERRRPDCAGPRCDFFPEFSELSLSATEPSCTRLFRQCSRALLTHRCAAEKDSETGAAEQRAVASAAREKALRAPEEHASLSRWQHKRRAADARAVSADNVGDAAPAPRLCKCYRLCYDWRTMNAAAAGMRWKHARTATAGIVN
ncbi:hypothetical protein MRX96_010500 [Rhipicephalus microplus]